MANINLLSTTNRVEVPYIKVKIGEYVFGVFSKSKITDGTSYSQYGIQYPNYIQSLQVKKINGNVNNYTLVLKYAITQYNDPNFFDKVFSSVSKSRKMVLSYGDMSTPSFIFKDEECVIKNIRQTVDVRSSVIQYTISAVSNAFLSTMGAYTFKGRNDKPSNVIKELFSTNYYGLQEVFPGMKDWSLVEQYNLIPQDDKIVLLETKTNISPLDYLTYLVQCMKPFDTSYSSLQQGAVYALNIIDTPTQINSVESQVFDGAYFKIIKNNKYNDALDTYSIDIGFPSQNTVISFDIENNETYSLLYDFQDKINNEDYVERINSQGDIIEIYSPVISSGNNHYKTQEEDKTWWTKVTEYPIKVTITLKGLLRPAILMNYVRLNTYFYGNKFNGGTGLFIITQQVDTIDTNGYKTTLSLTRVGGDNPQ